VAITVHASQDVNAKVIQDHVVEMLRRMISAVDDSDLGTVEIHLGSVPRKSRVPVVHVGVTNAEIVISKTPVSEHDPAAEIPEIALLIAACYAAAMAVRVTIGPHFSLPSHDTIRLPLKALLRSIRDGAGPVPMSKLYLAGAGAIGNAFLWGLSTFRVEGELWVVDPKTVSSGNLGRCVWFREADVGQPKAVRLAANAQPSLRGMRLLPHVGTVQTLPERNDGPWLENLVVAVDSRRARRRLQEELPCNVFDASTTGIEEVVLSFNSAHEAGACLSCVYHEDAAEAAHETHVATLLGVSVSDVQEHLVSESAAQRIAVRHPQVVPSDVVGLAFDTLFKTMCAMGQLGVDAGRTVLAPFSFVSVLAGAYLALEVVSRISAGQTTRPFNHWHVSPWASPVLDLQSFRRPLEGCETCGNAAVRATVQEVWGTHGPKPP
jgi:hypothetical protein